MSLCVSSGHLQVPRDNLATLNSNSFSQSFNNEIVIFLYSFESSVHVVFTIHLRFTSPTTQRGVIPSKPLGPYCFNNLIFKVFQKKILNV